jgi:hypothetical protein
MNNILIVRKTGDLNYIPVKYRVVEMTVGSTAGATYCVLQCIDRGWDTEAHWNDWKAGKSPSGDYSNPTGRKSVGAQGTIGALEVETLDNLAAYKPYTPSHDRQG